jgi:hypothetical protein
MLVAEVLFYYIAELQLQTNEQLAEQPGANQKEKFLNLHS